MEESRSIKASVKSSDSSTTGQKRAERPLRYRTRVLWLLLLYVLLIVIPWILTCILAHRPISARSYIYQRGFSDREVSHMRNWRLSVVVLNSIAAVVTVPILSAVLAQAVVVFCQRRKSEEFLSVRGMLALSDRGWTNIPILWKAMRSSRPKDPSIPKYKSTRTFLSYAVCLIILGAIQQPLYQTLVEVGTVQLTTLADTSFTGVGIFIHFGLSEYPRSIGVDIEPASVALMPQVTIRSRVASDLASISIDEAQPNLWRENLTAPVPKSLKFRSQSPTLAQLVGDSWDPDRRPGLDFFVASLPAESTTGVLRQHLMRLNSSVECEEINRETLPSPCPGKNPFTVSLERGNDTNVNICVPGDFTVSPWTLSRNRQEHLEDIYIDIWDTVYEPLAGVDKFGNITSIVHCAAKTTRGVFELGNARNNDSHGPILGKWPSKDKMAENYNDWAEHGRYVPSEEDDFEGKPPYDPTSPYDDPNSGWKMPGPLTLSAMALFGNGSWLDTVIKYTANMTYTDDTRHNASSWQLLCGAIPFGKLQSVSGSDFFESWGKSIVHDCHQRETASFLGWHESSRYQMMLLAHDLLTYFGPDPMYENNPSKILWKAEKLLEISMFATNRALLTSFTPEVDREATENNGRHIYTSPGVLLQKPEMSTAAMIILSTLLGIQLLALGYLTYYLRKSPTWSDQLDSMALVRIGASLGERGLLPPIGPVSEEDLAALENVQALIGIVEDDKDDEGFTTRSVSQDLSAEDGTDIELQQLAYREETQTNAENSTDVELQRLTSKEEAQMNVEEYNTDIQLALGASGAISSGLVPLQSFREVYREMWKCSIKACRKATSRY